MNEPSILLNLLPGDVRLKQLNTKKIKPTKKAKPYYSTKWQYKIVNFDERKLELLAYVDTILDGMFEMKVCFEVDYKLRVAMEEDEIHKNITDILYYTATNYTLLSSFISNFMFGITIPVSPNIQSSDISILT